MRSLPSLDAHPADRQSNARRICGARSGHRGTTLRRGPLPPTPSREGRGVIFLDADDWLAPDALSRFSAALEASPDAVAASGPCTFADTGAACSPPCGDILPRLLVRNLFANCGQLLLRVEAVNAAGGLCQVSPMARTGSSAFELRWKARWLARPADPVVRSPTRRRRVSAPRAERGRVRTCMNAIFSHPALLGPVWSARIGGDPPAYRGREHLDRRPRAGPPRLPCTLALGLLRRRCLLPTSRKAAMLLAAAHLLHLLPTSWRGPLQAVSRLRDFVASRRSAVSPASTIPTTVAGTRCWRIAAMQASALLVGTPARSPPEVCGSNNTAVIALSLAAGQCAPVLWSKRALDAAASSSAPGNAGTASVQDAPRWTPATSRANGPPGRTP